ncbi:hypothetical protein R2103_09015 [Nitrosomonas sp. Is24]|uniref:hypothetical protein n=1 Tax=Nitrosomonas sp. Is24 TaxID=3080533 RepID=UPI00294B985F|nr:hypothetical protein [Nitrosomonas sp. Is24]MDV6341903.1 hypothetical protein [Nitrosomonas sp. Is24]
MNKFGIAFILLLCSGCAYYKTPTTGPTALLELRSNASTTIVRYFLDDQCTVDPDNPIGRLALLYGDTLIRSAKNNMTRRVVAERDFVITFLSKSPSGAYTDQLCDVSSSFYPKDGATYSIKLDASYNNCRLEILRQVIAGGKISYQPEESQRNLERVCRYSRKND